MRSFDHIRVDLNANEQVQVEEIAARLWKASAAFDVDSYVINRRIDMGGWTKLFAFEVTFTDVVDALRDRLRSENPGVAPKVTDSRVEWVVWGLWVLGQGVTERLEDVPEDLYNQLYTEVYHQVREMLMEESVMEGVLLN